MQPDYRKWHQVEVGMAREEVTRLLGPPLTGREQRPVTKFDSSYSHYGFISYPALPNKWVMTFIVGFDKQDRVWWKSDPFGGVPLSRTGKPSKPRIVCPINGAGLSHFPRLLDIRWFPSSGVYPIQYELELRHGDPISGEFRGRIELRQFGQPYAVIAFAGAQPGCIRVRGRNAKGVGSWSDPVTFYFTL